MEYVGYTIKELDPFPKKLKKTVVLVVKDNPTSLQEASLEMVFGFYSDYVNGQIEPSNGLISDKYDCIDKEGTYLISNNGFFYSKLTSPVEVQSLLDFIVGVDNGKG